MKLPRHLICRVIGHARPLHVHIWVAQKNKQVGLQAHCSRCGKSVPKRLSRITVTHCYTLPKPRK